MATVEAELELGKVAPDERAADGLVGSRAETIGVCEQSARVTAWKQPSRLRRHAFLLCEMLAGRRLDAGAVMGLDEMQEDTSGPALIVCLNGDDERDFVCAPSPRLPTSASLFSPPNTALSVSMRPLNVRLVSISTITAASFWRMRHALSHLAPIWCDNSRVEIEFFDCVINYIAWKHLVSASSEFSNTLPAVSEVCLRQPWQR